MKDLLRKFIPLSLIAAIKYGFYFTRDTIDWLLGRTDPTIPPTRLMFVGTRSATVFKQNGERNLKYFIALCGLKPHEAVLDVGCGIGRQAIPLTRYLNQQGRYEGIDIVKIGITWCQEHITPKHPNFQFQVADIYNQNYNPYGKYTATTYKFPFPDSSFDLVVLNSVFTHMLPADVTNYFSEISRVLKPQGRCLITYFLANEHSLKLTSQPQSRFNFKYRHDHFYTTDKYVPEKAVCYDEAFILDLYQQNGLIIQPPIYYGSWTGHPGYLTLQDIIVAIKK